ncbi:MAG: hypothetical protein ACRYFX_17785 [Janthinobacterium lividum]
MNQKHLLFFLLLLLAGTAFGRPAAPTAVQLAHLRCELLTNPEGIDATAPRLSWELSSAGRGLEQTAYQLLVASTPEKLAADEGDLWNSGKVGGGSRGWWPTGARRCAAASAATGRCERGPTRANRGGARRPAGA